jgi:hypothetical protein
MARDRSWLDGLPFGLPIDFDFTVLRTPSDASDLIYTLPTYDRGKAAKRIFDQADDLSRAVSHAAWEHDHQHVLRAFDVEVLGFMPIVRAFRKLAVPTKRKRSIQSNARYGTDCTRRTWPRRRPNPNVMQG